MKKYLKFVDKWVFFVSLICIVTVVGLLICIPSEIKVVIEASFKYLINTMQSTYILLSVVSFIFFIYIVLSKYGDIRFGDKKDKPAYSEFSWAAMIFTSGTGSSAIILGFVEPIYYLKTTPFSIVPFSTEAYEFAHMYGQFHWGFSAWALYVPSIIAIGYFMHVKKIENATMGLVLVSFMKKSKFQQFLKSTIDILIVFGIIMSITTSLGLGVPVLAELISYTFNIPSGVYLQCGVFGIWFLIFTWSVVRGLDKGIKILSDLNMYLIFLFLGIFIFVSPIMKIFSMEINSIGLYINNFTRMLFYTDPFGDGAFVNDWSVFYIAWWASFIAIMGIFVARISAGRTIRQVVVGQLVWGSLGCIAFLGLLGGYSLYLQNTGAIDLYSILESQGSEATILAILNTVPFGDLIIVIMCVLCFVFMATTIDSTAYVLSIVTTICPKNQEPPLWVRVTWAVTIFLLAVTLSIVGGLALIQKFAIVVAFPLVFIGLMLIYICMKMLRKDFGHMTREQIEQKEN